MPNKKPTNFEIHRQGMTLISNVVGTIVMFTLLGYGVKAMWPLCKMAVPIAVILGAFFGFAIMIKDVLLSDRNQE